MERNTLYIAYGSNLNITQMGYRCPFARVHGVGRIEDYRLAFKALGACAYATIEPSEGDYVPVVLWEIGQCEEKRLDRYEGFPTHYYKKEIIVQTAGRETQGMVYVMNETAHYARPEQQYFNAVLEGYRSFGLEEHKLYEALYRAENKESFHKSTLQLYRKMNMLTQKQLAEKSGLKEGMIQKYETGERDIAKGRAESVLKLADALGVPVRELIR